MQKILVYTVGQLGDILVLMPILAGIRALYPKAHITLLNKHDSVAAVSPLELTRQAGYVDEIEIVSKHSLRWMRFLSFIPGFLRKKYDCVYWLCRDSSTLSHKIRRERGFFQRMSKSPVQGMFSLEDLTDKHREYPRITEMLLARLNQGNTHPFVPGTHLFPLTTEDKSKAENCLCALGIPKERLPFVVCIGGKKSVGHWPLEKYAVLLNSIITQTSFVPVFCGGPRDAEEIATVRQKLPEGMSFYAKDIACDLKATIALMSCMKFYLGNDTGSLHMAAAAGLRCVAIFSSVSRRGFWRPLGEGHIIFRCKDTLDCEACGKGDCPYGTPAKCINSITPEEVFENMKPLFQLQ